MQRILLSDHLPVPTFVAAWSIIFLWERCSDADLSISPNAYNLVCPRNASCISSGTIKTLGKFSSAITKTYVVNEKKIKIKNLIRQNMALSPTLRSAFQLDKD